VTDISSEYRELLPEEVDDIARQYADAWQNPLLPALQYSECVLPELQKFRSRIPVPPFDALIACLEKIPSVSSILDVGASSGYYRRVLDMSGYTMSYVGIDSSPAMVELGRRMFMRPDDKLDLGDACDLPYPDASFDVVLSGGTIMHIRDYEKAIAEMVRVSNKYVILHRTPVSFEQPMAFYLKKGYGVPMFEILFNQQELLRLCCDQYGLSLALFYTIFWNKERRSGHRTFVFVKDKVVHVAA